ncbi:SDR family NAD(P)-dependent oxidoreductase [Enterococcus dongliensis]|uniref:SDR family NAD(P)-dependent oxidoreductase n=1 Tax=Enterococcus dongliensis TaxID=2559925 RepID=UPI0035D961FA
MNQTKKVTLITGANKGIGFEIAKQVGEHGHHVLVGSRDEKRGAEAVKQLLDLGIEADFIQIDVTNKESINKAAELIEEKYGYLTALINNAGISLDKFIVSSKLDTEIIRQNFDVNFFGLVDTTQAMLPLLKKSTKVKIINMSSMMGSLNIAATPESEVYHASVVGYQASKVAVNIN